MRVTSLLISLLLFVPFDVGPQVVDGLNLSVITSQNIDDLVVLERFELADVEALDWSDDSERLVVSSYEGIWLLDLSEMQLQQINLGDNIIGYDVVFAEDSNRVIVEGSSALFIYDLSSGKVDTIPSPSGTLRAVNDGATLYAVIDSEWNSENQTMITQRVSVYGLPDSARLLEVPVTLYEGFCFYACHVGIDFSPDNRQLAFTAAVPEVESGFVNLETGDKLAMPRISYWGTAYASDGSLLASTSGQAGYIADSLIIISAETAEIVAQIGLFASSPPEFNYANELLALGVYNADAPNFDEATGFIYFFRVSDFLASDDPRQIGELSFGRPPKAIAFSPDGTILAVSEGNGSLSLWVIE